jgi:hypothetical protein
MPDETLLARAEGYLRTAAAALESGDLAPAYENARTACELAAKQMLAARGVSVGKEHNVARPMVEAGLWPGGEPGKRLSKFLGDYTRGVYGFSERIRRLDVERGISMAEQMIAKAKAR